MKIGKQANLYIFYNIQLMKRNLTYLLASVMTILSCSKNSGPKPGQANAATPQAIVAPVSSLGSFSGIISPAKAVKTVTFVLSATGKSYSCIPDTATGSFKMDNLPEGLYRVTFVNDARYGPLAYLNAPIFAGKNNDLGSYSTTIKAYYLSYEINGVFEGWPFQAYYPSSSFYIGPLAIGGIPEDTRTAYYLSISVDGLVHPGTYTCKGTSKSKINYSGYRLGSGVRISYQSTEYIGGEGTIIITSIDANKRIVQGTFTATLTSASGNAADTKVVRNGVINAPY